MEKPVWGIVVCASVCVVPEPALQPLPVSLLWIET